MLIQLQSQHLTILELELELLAVEVWIVLADHRDGSLITFL
jgi:hypothetical protein